MEKNKKAIIMISKKNVERINEQKMLMRRARCDSLKIFFFAICSYARSFVINCYWIYISFDIAIALIWDENVCY